jgi:hypothetical protein
MLVAVPAFAQPPLNGTYKSTDLGGMMLTGRYSESWANGTKLDVDNTMNEQSWDGATLGTEWWWYCPKAVSVVLLADLVDGNGNGQKIWRVSYTGGVMVLDGNGPWGGGDPSYTATVTTWNATVTEQFSNFVETLQVRSISATGTFVGFNAECITLQVSNTEKFGDTDGGALPGDFPPFLDGNTCAPVGGAGEWGDVDEITFSVVDCETVPTREASWGSVKAMYNE